MNGGPVLPSAAAVVRVEIARLAKDELLVVLMPPSTAPDLIDAINAACSSSQFHGRVLVLAADAEMWVLNSDQAQRLSRPTGEQVVQLPPLSDFSEGGRFKP